MFVEEDLLPISALQHLAFCERQWALIYLEQQWTENRFTAEGRVLHERADEQETESRQDLRIARGLRIHSLRLGLVGIADVVEFTRLAEGEADTRRPSGVVLRGVSGLWQPMPVEYKRGRPKPDVTDEVQLCAQALCLEEMLATIVDRGAIFYGRPRRRTEVVFDDDLRRTTEELCARLHQMYRKGLTPTVAFSRKCDNCSLLDACQPKKTNSSAAAGQYVASALKLLVEPEEPGTDREELP